MSGEPFPKSQQLARGERRYRRKVASPKQWQAIIAAKQGPCRVCRDYVLRVDCMACNQPAFTPPCDLCIQWEEVATEPSPQMGRATTAIQMHHLVPRDLGGDDIADNIVPLHTGCHMAVTMRHARPLRTLASSLSPVERAYCESKLGGQWVGRLFGSGR